MHVGRSLAISLALCIIFFVLLRPPQPPVGEDGPVVVQETPTAPEPAAADSGAGNDSLAGAAAGD